jgi:hypothetical protein
LTCRLAVGEGSGRFMTQLRPVEGAPERMPVRQNGMAPSDPTYITLDMEKSRFA